MRTYAKRRSHLILLSAALAVVSLDAWCSSALADGPAAVTKGIEVSTVGTAPYLGPLPEELAKLAQPEATTVISPSPAKEPDTATITRSGGNTLTEAELAKVAALLLLIPAPPPEPAMLKLEVMPVPKDGVPQLTAQEREKRARELAALPVITPVAPTASPSTSKSGR